MRERSDPAPDAGWRLKTGIALFVLSVIAPAAGLTLLSWFGLSGPARASISAAVLIAGDALGMVAVAIMGRAGYLRVKDLMLGFVKRHAPPREVSRVRYNIGLVMFCLPISFAWLSGYAAEFIPGFVRNPLPYAIGGDLLLLASFFVLGGHFWDKLRSLFVHDAVAQFP